MTARSPGRPLIPALSRTRWRFAPYDLLIRFAMLREEDQPLSRSPRRLRAEAMASWSLFSRRPRAISPAPKTPWSEAFAFALADRPVNGAPQSPEAWLLAVARRKIVDAPPGADRLAPPSSDHLQLLAEELEGCGEPGAANSDERLALMFACAHPAIEPGIQGTADPADNPRL